MAQKKKAEPKKPKSSKESAAPIIDVEVTLEPMKRYRLKNAVYLPRRGRVLRLKPGHVLNEGPLVGEVKRLGGVFEDVAEGE